ncbi:MAG: hypothetical protein Q8O26_07785 [Phreatobacter sp.]|jgi:hypothetical protein|nr:hypothetical protein [Phreatobacter sp.]MDP2801770.1 hypothetical protein [Phreatobacter sp.]
MTPEETALPRLVAPPLSPAGSFDADVADLHEVEWLRPEPIVRKD